MLNPLKISFPTPLPKNEKDIICMLLAGRLKDLLNGRLVCAQLAVDDLIKDVTGISALNTLRDSLVKMNSSINDLKTATGYDKILHGLNQALGQVNNVFSLGGLCPSPVHPPVIPDLVAQLNSNLFGQAGNILNALGKVANPSMCLGGGPRGFGINWNSMPGDLKNLKNAVAGFKRDPGNFQASINAFNQNLKSQTSRLKSEIKRLEQNLSDPLGLNGKLNTTRNLERVKSVSDGYPVKDANGILHANVLKSMVPADIESVIDNIRYPENTNPIKYNLNNIPIKYITKPILDYCGEIVGYEKVAITGDGAYIGWDPNGDQSLNTDNPTTNPIAGYSSYTYTFQQDGSAVNVYKTDGLKATSLTLTRGVAYRINFDLINKAIQFYSDSTFTTLWFKGFTYSRNPAYGKDMEMLIPDATTKFVRGELDWAVLLENPTTPNTIYWKTNDNSSSGSIIIDGLESIPVADRTYDLSMAVRKSLLQLIHVTEPRFGVQYENSVTTRTYNARTRVYDATGAITNTATDDSILTEVTDDPDITDGKIIKTITKFNDTKKLITKRYISIEHGLEYNNIYYYVVPNTNLTEAAATFCVFVHLNEPLILLNSSKLPYVDHCAYKLTYMTKVNGEFIPPTEPISNSDDSTFELITKGSKQFIRWNLTSNNESKISSMPKNDFIFQTDIEIDPVDTKRTFIDSNPVEYRTYFYVKFGDGTAFDSTIISNGNVVAPPIPLPTPMPVPTPISSSTTAFGLSLIFG